MSGTMKNVLLLVLLVGLTGLAGYFFVRGDPERKIPDTAESATTWICTECKKTISLTARQVETLLNSPDKVRRGEQYDPKLIVFWCDDCKKFSVVRAWFCEDHKVWSWYKDPDGRPGGCPECEKLMRQ